MADLGSRRRKAVAEPPDPTAAMEIAVGYLGTRPRTRWETERRLRRAGTPEPVIDEIVGAEVGTCFGPDTLAEARNRGYSLARQGRRRLRRKPRA